MINRVLAFATVAMIIGVFQPAMFCSEAGRPASDGSIFIEDFQNLEINGIPEGWERFVQEVNERPVGYAGVCDSLSGRTFRMRDGNSHIAVWSARDDVLPEDKSWAVQFDLHLAAPFQYKPGDMGAVFGLKEGLRNRGGLLPIIHLDNEENAKNKIALTALGEILDADLDRARWHRIVIRREGTTWSFYLNDELKATVSGVDSDFRGYAMGSFINWQHVARDMHYGNFKVGRFVRH